jgi:hypothetical protein
VKLRTSSLDLLAAEFASAVASQEHERAEGWLRVAMHVAQRRSPGAGGRRLTSRVGRFAPTVETDR